MTLIEEKDLIEEREICLITKNKEKIEGVIHSVKDGWLILCRTGDWTNRERFNLKEIKVVSVSEHPYSSFNHHLELRDNKKPLLEFRFTEKDLRNLVGKYATVNYDGKLIEGRITSYVFKKNNPSTITIVNDSLEKEVEDYRLISLEIVESAIELERKNKILEIYEECYQLIREQKKMKPKINDGDLDPDYLLEEFLKGKIEILKGNISHEVKEHDWIKEKIKSNESHSSSSGDPKLYEEIKNARMINEYYQNMKETINQIFYKVQKVNWENYNIAQLTGEIETLEYLLETNSITI